MDIPVAQDRFDDVLGARRGTPPVEYPSGSLGDLAQQARSGWLPSAATTLELGLFDARGNHVETIGFATDKNSIEQLLITAEHYICGQCADGLSGELICTPTTGDIDHPRNLEPREDWTLHDWADACEADVDNVPSTIHLTPESDSPVSSTSASSTTVEGLQAMREQLRAYLLKQACRGEPVTIRFSGE